MKYRSLRTKILAIVITLTILLLIIVNVYNYQDRKELLYNISIEKLLILTKIMHKFEKKQLRLYQGRINTLQKDEQLIALIQSNNKKELSKYLNKIHHAFTTATPTLIHMHLFSTNKNHLYHYDNIKRSIDSAQKNQVLQEVIKNKKLTTGYVLFNKSDYFYSIIAPIKNNDKIIAYIEFGLTPDNKYKIASKAGRYKYALYLHEDDGVQSKQRKIGKQVTSNSAIFEDLNINQAFIYEYANKNKVLQYHDKYYLIHQYDIETPFQKNFAQVIMASDVTKYVQENNQKTLVTIILSLFILSIIYISIYLALTKLINKLEEDEEELNISQKQMQIIIDYNESLIALFTQSQLVLANKSFISFFNIKTLDDFKTKYNSFNELFLDVEGVFSPRDKENKLSWLEEIHLLRSQEKIVALQHEKYGIAYFNLQIHNIANQKNSFVVVLSDVTTIFKKSQQDQYMARHDSLTGIFNRQSFNESITHDLLQQVSHKHSSSLLMFDLDLFKKVNDTYGHKRGDEVLKTFVKIISHNIRTNDIFARWGGEEFVLLLIDTSEQTAIIIANNLREKIANTKFEEVEHITCSIGLSSYKEGDSAESWFLRVDTALYKAKENGRDRVEVL
jgi:diguanylate cyclase (GGDEF)-like protein